MYERKIPVDLSCPLRLTMSLIDSKWKSCILDELRNTSMRPSELHKAEVNSRTVTKTFEEMQEHLCWHDLEKTKMSMNSHIQFQPIRPKHLRI